MLGRNFFPGTESYVIRAGEDYKYFKLQDNEWNALNNFVQNNEDEMWKINKKFLERALLKRDDIFLSHNPYDPEIVQYFYKREIEFLKVNHTFEEVGENLWKVIKKN